ncbi:hypothetical protein [Rubripirellula reticaptiva]|nr:hypothetical protein [Rubripirellula reticaptiva]
MLILLLTLGILWGTPVTAEDDATFQPYTVYVAQEESHARCGPSADAYRTDELRHGQALEVYFEAKDGWLGIRPPESAFCWIPAETVKLDASGDNGLVIEDHTVAWIGTHLGRARSYKWQVQLAEGEPVAVIGKSEREGPDGPQLWYRIVPPSGEFRWVHRDQVVTNSEELIASLDREVPREEIMFAEAGPTSPRNSIESTSRQRSGIRDPRSQVGANTKPQSVPTSRPASRSSVADTKPVSSRRVIDEPELVQASGQSVLDNAAYDNGVEMMPIGSGLKESWQANQIRRTTDQPLGSIQQSGSGEDLAALHSPPSLSTGTSNDASSVEPTKRKGLIASVAFLGRPKLGPIGAEQNATQIEPASEDSWVSGIGRRIAAATTTEPPMAPQTQAASMQAFASPSEPVQSPATLGAPSPVMQVSGSLPMPAQQLSPAASGWAPSNGMAPAVVAPILNQVNAKPMNVVSSQRIEQIRQEASGADIDTLTLLLSRLMSAQASGLETEPVAAAARQLVGTANDTAIATRARKLAERADQYARLANRRDGNAMIRNQGDLMLADAQTPEIDSLEIPSGLGTIASAIGLGAPQAPSASEAVPAFSGQLVQVYSARPNSPPFALTDNTGRTVAYVTPIPGVNLRTHLNSHVNVIGTAGYLPGLNMPHVLASQAVRTPQ